MTTSPFLSHGAKLLAGFLGTAGLAWIFTGQTGVLGLLPRHNEYRAQMLWGWKSLPEPKDVLIIGSSRVGKGLYSTRVEADLQATIDEPVSIYELGIAGLRVEFLRYLLEAAVQPRPPRRLLVLCVEARLFAIPAAEDGRAIEGEWDAKSFTRKDWTTPLWGLRDLYSLAWTFRSETQEAQQMLHANNGEWGTLQQVRQDHRKLVQAQANIRRRDQDKADSFALEGLRWEWPTAEDAATEDWEAALDLLEALPCEVVFVRMPLAPGFDQEYMAEIYPTYTREVVERLQSRGFEYVDLQGAGWNDRPRWFRSLTHLNDAGASKVSSRFGTELLPRLLASKPADGAE